MSGAERIAVNTIQAIQTRYAGCRFRSRLEARWAVFFDAMDLPWNYEPEGFTLPSGDNYLPDFWLSSLRVYAEVKPAFDFSWAQWATLIEFGNDADKPILLLVGLPEKNPMVLIDRYLNRVGLDRKWWDEDPEKEGLVEQMKGMFRVQFSRSLGFDLCLVRHNGFENDQLKLERAARLAAGARFEFGEKGGVA